MRLYGKTMTRETCFFSVFAAGVKKDTNSTEKYLSIFNDTIENIDLGYNTPFCVHVSSAVSGGVFHSRSQCDSGSRLYFQDNHRPSKASPQRWAAQSCLVLAH